MKTSIILLAVLFSVSCAPKIPPPHYAATTPIGRAAECAELPANVVRTYDTQKAGRVPDEKAYAYLANSTVKKRISVARGDSATQTLGCLSELASTYFDSDPVAVMVVPDIMHIREGHGTLYALAEVKTGIDPDDTGWQTFVLLTRTVEMEVRHQ